MAINPPYLTLLPLFEELRGERVSIRPFKEADAQELFEAVAQSREQLRPWLPWANAHQTLEETRDFIIQQQAHWLLREELTASVWEHASGRFLGGIGLFPHNWQTRSFEIGYWLRTGLTGNGYMTEAARLLVTYLFEELAATRVQIRCDERNTSSAAIPRRLGFVQEGRLRNHEPAPDGSLRTTLVFAQIPADRT